MKKQTLRAVMECDKMGSNEWEVVAYYIDGMSVCAVFPSRSNARLYKHTLYYYPNCKYKIVKL
jgi:hypothetical protein